MKKLLFLLPIVFVLLGAGCDQTNSTLTNTVKTLANTSSQETSATPITKTPITDSKLTSTERFPAITTETLYVITSVTDGDTIKVNINGKIETIRLIGIDTPETVDPRKVVQCFGKEASNKAKELLNGKKVRLEADSTQGERDKYNRLLRYVFIEGGAFYNKIIIAEGYAHEYTYNSNPYKYQTEFIEAEKNAREAGKGLWNVSTCNGDTTQSAVKITPSPSAVNTPTEISPSASGISEPQVKKSVTGICHEKGTTYYLQTKSFISYNSIADCLASGGRLPK